MSSEYDLRAAIIVCLRAGCTPKEITEFTKLPKSTVYEVAKAFKNSDGSGTPARKTHNRSECKNTPQSFSRPCKTWLIMIPELVFRQFGYVLI